MNTRTNEQETALQLHIAQLRDAIRASEGPMLCKFLAHKVIDCVTEPSPAEVRPMAYRNMARLAGFKLEPDMPANEPQIIWTRKAGLALVESLEVIPQ